VIEKHKNDSNPIFQSHVKAAVVVILAK